MPTPPARPLRPDDAVKAANSVSNGVRGLLGFTDDMFNDRAGFIAGDGGGWPLAEAVRSVSQYNCRRWGAADKSNFSSRVNAGNAALCNRYLDGLGEKPPDGGVFGPDGKGRCSTLYRVEIPAGSGALRREFSCSTGALTSSGFTATTRSVGSIPGPIQRILAKTTTTGTCGASTIVLVVVGADGIEYLGGTLLTATAGRRIEVDIVSPIIERQDGLPDNCADAGGEIIPPGRPSPVPTLPPNIKINIPGLGPTTITVTPNDDGDPVVCYEELDLCVTIPVGGGTSVGGTGANPGAPEEGSTAGTGDGGEAEDEAPPGRELYALKIGIVSFPARPVEYAPGVYRGVCYVYMGDDNGLDHDPAGAMLRSGQLVLAEKEGLTKWRVAANSGYNLNITPYYRTPREES